MFFFLSETEITYIIYNNQFIVNIPNTHTWTLDTSSVQERKEGVALFCQNLNKLKKYFISLYFAFAVCGGRRSRRAGSGPSTLPAGLILLYFFVVVLLRCKYNFKCRLFPLMACVCIVSQSGAVLCVRRGCKAFVSLCKEEGGSHY